MRTKVFLLSTTLLVSAGATMHHFKYCPLQHLMSAMSHHQAKTAPAKEVKTADTKATLAQVSVKGF